MRSPATRRSRRGVNVLDGKITYEAVAEAHGLDYTPLEDVLPLARALGRLGSASASSTRRELDDDPGHTRGDADDDDDEERRMPSKSEDVLHARPRIAPMRSGALRDRARCRRGRRAARCRRLRRRGLEHARRTSPRPSAASTCPNMEALGLGNVEPLDGCPPQPGAPAVAGRLLERSKGKDTTTGHWELMGVVTAQAFPMYPHGFPHDVIDPFMHRTGRGVLGNKPASGTEIIQELGEEHQRDGQVDRLHVAPTRSSRSPRTRTRSRSRSCTRHAAPRARS